VAGTGVADVVAAVPAVWAPIGLPMISVAAVAAFVAPEGSLSSLSLGGNGCVEFCGSKAVAALVVEALRGCLSLSDTV
jgi:hypothetical protein